jgi:hypothetical protein
MMIWKPKASFTLTILSGRSYTEQGGFPWAHANRHTGKTFLLNEDLDNSETGIDVKWGLLQDPATSVTVLPGTVILIESEKMLVTSVSGATLTVTRGYAGTSAVAHTNSSTGLTISVVTTGDGAIDLTGISWMSVITPTAWDAADLCAFACTTRDGTYVPMRDETGTILSIAGIPTAAAASLYVPGKVNAGGPWVKFRSITVGTDPTSAVNQSADRTLTVVVGE